jgi:hypothetical protein
MCVKVMSAGQAHVGLAAQTFTPEQLERVREAVGTLRATVGRLTAPVSDADIYRYMPREDR